jgi:hypothetical protein
MRIIWLTALVLLIILTVFHMILPIIRLPFKMEIDLDEGWNAFFSQKAIAGQPLYLHPTPWISVNYLPFSFYVVGALGRLLGDTLLAGRLVSVLSLLMLALGISLIVAKLSRNSYASIFAGFICLGSFAAFGTYYVGKNDPEMLGHLWSFAALSLYVLDEAILHKPKKLFFVALLCLVGAYVKPSIVAIPLAISLNILMRSRRKFLLWLALGSLAVVGLVLPSLLIWGKGVFVQVLGFPRTYSLAKLAADALLFALINAIPLLALYPWLRRRAKANPVRVASLYLGMALIVGLSFSGGHGTDVNMFFDFLIALSLLVGLFLSEVNEGNAARVYRHRAVTAVIPFAVMAGFLFLSIMKIPQTDDQSEIRFGVWRPSILQILKRSQRVTMEDASFVQQAKGPVICEGIILCFFSHKEFIFDPFFVREAIEKRKINESDLLNKIDAGYFDLIQLEGEIGRVPQTLSVFSFVRKDVWYDRWTGNMKKEIAKHYRIARRSINGVFYVPIASR